MSISSRVCCLVVVFGLLVAVARGQNAVLAEGRLAAIVKANDFSLGRLEKMRLEYTIRTERSGVEQVVPGNVFVRFADDKFRLLLANQVGQGKTVDRLILDGVEREQRYDVGFDLNATALQLCNQYSYKAVVKSSTPGKFASLFPKSTDRVSFSGVSHPLRLRELTQEWDCRLIEDSGGVVRIRADYPSGRQDGHEGSYAILKLRPDRGHLIESADVLEVGVGTDVATGKPAKVFFTQVVLDWIEVDSGVWYPRHVRFGNHGVVDGGEPSREEGYFANWITDAIELNIPDDDWLGFRFPNNAVVAEIKDAATGEVYLWGKGLEPAKVFASEAEFEAYRVSECNPKNARGPELVADGGNSWIWPLFIFNLVAIVLLVVAYYGRRKIAG